MNWGKLLQKSCISTKSCVSVSRLIFNVLSERRQYNYRNYQPEILEVAVNAVLKHELSQRQASRTYGVPQPTISKRIRMMRARQLAHRELEVINEESKNNKEHSKDDTM